MLAWKDIWLQTVDSLTVLAQLLFLSLLLFFLDFIAGFFCLFSVCLPFLSHSELVCFLLATNADLCCTGTAEADVQHCHSSALSFSSANGNGAVDDESHAGYKDGK